MQTTPTTTQSITRRLSGLTGKGHAAVLLIAVRDHWDSLSPSQRQEVAEILERLAVAMRRQHSVGVPLLGRIVA